MKILTACIIAASVVLALSSCDDSLVNIPESGKGGNGGAARDLTVRGHVLEGRAIDARGNPLKGVSIYAGNPEWDNYYVAAPIIASTDKGGNYVIPELLDGQIYKAFARIPVDFHGKEFCLRLSPATSSEYETFSATDGAVRNFEWKLQGKMKDSPFGEDESGAQYGGSVQIFPTFSNGDDYTGKVELRLYPTGPLVDGSEGKEVIRTVGLKSNIALDIPLGTYRASAILVRSDGARIPLKVGDLSSSAADSASLEFEPDSTSACRSGGTTTSNGIKRAYLHVFG